MTSRPDGHNWPKTLDFVVARRARAGGLLAVWGLLGLLLGGCVEDSPGFEPDAARAVDARVDAARDMHALDAASDMRPADAAPADAAPADAAPADAAPVDVPDDLPQKDDILLEEPPLLADQPAGCGCRATSPTRGRAPGTLTALLLLWLGRARRAAPHIRRTKPVTRRTIS